jgi:hypothetical protein
MTSRNSAGRVRITSIAPDRILKAFSLTREGFLRLTIYSDFLRGYNDAMTSRNSAGRVRGLPQACGTSIKPLCFRKGAFCV